jgi:uncharacterized membrane protein
MLNWALHFHLIAAIGWIGGSLFMFVLGITLVDKKSSKKFIQILGRYLDILN